MPPTAERSSLSRSADRYTSRRSHRGVTYCKMVRCAYELRAVFGAYQGGGNAETERVLAASVEKRVKNGRQGGMPDSALPTSRSRRKIVCPHG